MVHGAGIEVCHDDGVIGTGPLDADVMFIGIAPGKDEWTRTKEPFTGPAGELLNATLKPTGWQREKSFLTNLICWWNDAPSMSEIQQCWPRLKAEIATVNPRLIVLLGAIATDAIFAGSEYEKYTFGKLRGGVYWMEKFNCWVMPTYHPAAFLHTRDNDFEGPDIADFARDLYKIKYIVTWPCHPSYADVPYRIAQGAAEAEEFLFSIQGDAALDVETTYDGLKSVYEQHFEDDILPEYQDSKLLCFSVTDSRETMVIPGDVARQLRGGWGSRNDAVRWVMHNGTFDMAQVRHLLGEELKLYDDTILQSYSLDERGGRAEEGDRSVGIHGLKDLAREYCAAGFYNVKVLQVAPDALHAYNAKDSAYTYRLCMYFRERQIEDRVRDSFYRTLLIPAANALSEIQERGAYVDKSVLADLAMEWIPEWLRLEEQLVRDAKDLGWLGTKAQPLLNLNSSKQLISFVYDVLGAKPRKPVLSSGASKAKQTGRTTDASALEELAEEIPWCATLRRWRNLDHMISAYITGIEDDIKYDGRIHPEPVLHGTRSGRLAYHKPPIQTIPNKGVDPKLARIRRMLTVSPRDHDGEQYVIIEADYKQAEFWATYFASEDEALLEALLSGDMHGETSKLVFGVDETHEHWGNLRFLSKVTNFGILYGRGAQGFVDAPWRGHEPPPGLDTIITWNLKGAQEFIDKWAATYPKVWRWRKEEQQRAKRDGEQRTVTGRVRRYWLPTYKTLTQSINFIPQSLGHDHLLHSLILMHDALKPFKSFVLFEVHDALVMEVNRKYLREVIQVIREVMEAPKFGLPLGIPTDISIGYNWYDTEKVELGKEDGIVEKYGLAT